MDSADSAADPATDDWYSLVSTTTRCPECNRSLLVSWAIAHIYDDHGWSRTQIADWLDEARL